jgi:hypothetical protein
MTTYWLEVEVSEDVLSDSAYPIFDAYDNLIGGFSVKDSRTIKGFLSGNSEVSLFIDSDYPLYLSLKEGQDGKVISAKIEASGETKYSLYRKYRVHPYKGDRNV